MKKIINIWAASLLLSLSLTAVASAAPALGGNWSGTVKKVTDAACASAVVSLTLTQCVTGGVPGNLVRGTLKVGTATIKVVGKINPADNTFSLDGFEFDTQTGKSKSAIVMGKYKAPAGAAAASLQVNYFSFDASTSLFPANEA